MARSAARASAAAPIPPKEHSSILFVEKRRLDVLDGALVVVDNSGVRRTFQSATSPASCWSPALALATRRSPWRRARERWSHGSAKRVSALRAAGQPCGARSDRLLFQARLALDESARLKIVRKMYSMRFGEVAPERRSVEQLRGMEGAGSSGSVSFMRVKMP